MEIEETAVNTGIKTCITTDTNDNGQLAYCQETASSHALSPFLVKKTGGTAGSPKSWINHGFLISKQGATLVLGFPHSLTPSSQLRVYLFSTSLATRARRLLTGSIERFAVWS